MLCEFCHKNLAVISYRTFIVCESCKELDKQLTKQSEENAELRVRLQTEFHGYNMTPNEELFAKYYNRGKVLVKDLDDTSLREHRESLRKTATEAKASLMAADDEIRERNAGKKSKDKEWLVSVDTDRASSDAINAVNARKSRMSKMDKLREQLLSAGISEETVKEMIRDLERKATEKNLKTITFTKPVSEVSAIQVQNKKEEVSSEPFDPSKLKF